MMLDEFLEFLNTEEFDSCLGLPDSKYMSLFEDDQLLLRLLDLEWNEATYKKLCFIGLDATGAMEVKVNGERIYCSKICDNYLDLRTFLLRWFYCDVQVFPFEMYSAEIKPGIDLLKTLAQKKALNKFQTNKTYQKLLQEAKQKMSLKLKSTEILSFYLDQKWSASQYQNLMSLLHLLKDRQTFKWIHPLYHVLEKYMEDLSQMHYTAVPFEDWSDLARKSVSLLEKMIKENRLDQFKKDSEYIDLTWQLKDRYKNIEERDYKEINQKLNQFKKPSKETQKFIDFLDEMNKNKNKTIAFYMKNKKDILSQVDLLCAVVNLKWSEKTEIKLNILEYIISSELWRRFDGEKKHFDILPIYRDFKHYQNKGFSFGDRFEYYTPFSQLEDILREKLDLLKVLIQENKLKNYKKDSRFQKLRGKFYDRYFEIEFKNIKRLAEKGCDQNQYELACMYHAGEDIQQDYEKAFYWYKKSAEQGNIYAQNNAASMYVSDLLPGKKDYKKAFYWYSKSAERGDILAQTSLGRMYVEGRGCSQDYKKALYWYNKAIDKKNGSAEYELGEMYAKGLGVLKDSKKAFQLYESAAYKNCIPAQKKLSDLYFKGVEQPQDYKKAYIWIDIVCRHNLEKKGRLCKEKKGNIRAFIIIRFKGCSKKG